MVGRGDDDLAPISKNVRQWNDLVYMVENLAVLDVVSDTRDDLRG